MQIDDQTMFAEGFEEAFLGLGTQAGKQVAVYNKQKIFEILQKEMSSEEAVEYYQFNMECAFVGERTPVFLDCCNFQNLVEDVTLDS